MLKSIFKSILTLTVLLGMTQVTPALALEDNSYTGRTAASEYSEYAYDNSNDTLVCRSYGEFPSTKGLSAEQIKNGCSGSMAGSARNENRLAKLATEECYNNGCENCRAAKCSAE